MVVWPGVETQGYKADSIAQCMNDCGTDSTLLPRDILQVQSSPAAIRRQLDLLNDGGFLDTQSDMLPGRIVIYNQPLQSLSTY